MLKMRKYLSMILVLCWAFMLSAADYAVFAGGGEVMTVALSKSAEISGVVMKTKGSVTGVKMWNLKTLDPDEVAAKVSSVNGICKIEFPTPCKTTGLIISGKKLKSNLVSDIEVITAEGKIPVTGAVPVAGGKKLVPDPKADIANVLPNLIFYPGNESQKLLSLGSPNHLNRKDRVVVRLDLSDFIGKEKVKKAVFHLYFHPYRALYPRMVDVEVLKEEQDKITKDSGFGFSADPTASLLLPFAPRVGTFTVALDITADVNAALSKGVGSITYRLRDNHCDQFGNRRRKAYSIAVDSSRVYFSIAE